MIKAVEASILCRELLCVDVTARSANTLTAKRNKHDASDLYEPQERLRLVCNFIKCCPVTDLQIDYVDRPLFTSTIEALATSLTTLDIECSITPLDEDIIAKLLWHLRGLRILRLWGFDEEQHDDGHDDGNMSLRDAITSLPELRELQLWECPALEDNFA